MSRNRARRGASLSLVFTSAVAITSLALVGEARAEQGRSRLGFFPGRLNGKVTAGDPTQCGVTTYCGGPVLSNVQMVSVFWTNQVAQATTSWAPGYAASIVNSELLDMLSEYSTAGQTGVACGMQTPDAGIQYFGPNVPFSTGQTITRGSVPAGTGGTSGYTITPTQQTGSNITDDNAAIGLELVGQIAAGALPKPVYDAQGYPETLYVVYFPSSISISLQGMGSCSAFGGYHFSAPYAASGCKGQYIPYAVIPDCGGEGDQLSDVVSHELAEAITDTDVGPTTPATGNYGDGAWYLGPTNPCNAGNGNNCPQNCGEVGDVCQGAGDGTIPGSSIVSQDIWSNVQMNCALNNPSISTQTGPAPVAVCTSGSSSGGGSGSSSGSGSGSSSGSSSGGGSGSSSGGGSGGGSGSSSGSGSGGGSGSSSSGGSSGSGSGSGSSSGGLVEAGVDEAGGGDGGGNAVTSPSSSSGCACDMTGTTSSGGFAALGALLGLALLGRSRRR